MTKLKRSDKKTLTISNSSSVRDAKKRTDMELHALPNKCAPEERWSVFEKLILHRLDVLDEQAREGRKEHDDIKQDLTILKTRLSYLGVAATALPTIAGILYLIFGR